MPTGTGKTDTMIGLLAALPIPRPENSPGRIAGVRYARPPDVRGGVMGLRLKEFGFDRKVAGFGAERDLGTQRPGASAPWRLLLQLGTRTTVTPLRSVEGYLVAAFASLHRMFEVTREILQEAGPDVAQDREDGSPSLAALAVGILNDHLRPVLSKWHPLLDDRMAIRPPDVGPNQWEAEWGSNEEVRDGSTASGSCCGIPPTPWGGGRHEEVRASAHARVGARGTRLPPSPTHHAMI